MLQFNEGIGECLNKDERKVTNIKFLRSLLFNTMEKEVANCCDLSLDQSHQQVIIIIRPVCDDRIDYCYYS